MTIVQGRRRCLPTIALAKTSPWHLILHLNFLICEIGLLLEFMRSRLEDLSS